MVPQVLAGKYELQEEIARGGMGVIYKAFDLKLHGIVAIKLVHAHLSNDPSFAERFLREARAMTRLRQHENIVKIYAVEEEQRTQFLVMEYCPGRNLRAVIRSQSPLPVREAVHLIQQVASALAYAHAQGVIHRDIKPANVLVDQQGKAKLTDFGIAAALDEAALTSVGQVVGTPEYMSPEQARGHKLDGRADLYSLGIVMYEMLTGKTPYSESTGTVLLGKLAHDRDELPLQFSSHVPALVQGVVRDLLRRNPDDRIPDADRLASQLHEILHTLPQAPMTTAPEKPDSTIVSTTRPTQTKEPSRFTSPSATTVIAPLTRGDDQKAPAFTEVPAIHADSRRSPWADDKTTLLPSPPQTAPTYKVPQPTVYPPPLAPTSSPIKSLIVGGILLVVALVGLVSYLGSRPGNRIVTVIPTMPQPDTSPPSAPPSEDQKIALREQQLKDHEETLSKLEILVRHELDPFQFGKQATDCSELKALATDTYGKYEDELRKVNRLRHELEREPISPITRPAQLDMVCPSRKSPSMAHKPTPVPPPPAVMAKPPSEPTPSSPTSKPELSTPKTEIHTGSGPITSGSIPEPKPEPKSEPPPHTAPAQMSKSFPDAQLRSLLDQFTQAYERRDLDALRSISHMDEARQRNVETMFHNYKTFTLSIASISSQETGAAAVIVIDTAISSAGEVVDLSPIAKKITLRISRQGETWDKIEW